MLADSWAQTHDALVAELRQARERGLTRLRSAALPILQDLAARLHPEIADEPRALEQLLRDAVMQLGDGAVAAAAALLFGVAQASRGAPPAELRSRAAAAIGVSRDNFRKEHEPRILEDLAGAIAVIASHDQRDRPAQSFSILEYRAKIVHELGTLESVYTMLRFHERGREEQEHSHPALVSLDRLVRTRGSQIARDLSPQDLQRPGGRWLIAGTPGAGKTTLLKMLTLEAAQSDGSLPVLIDLGRYQSGDLVNLRLVNESVRHFHPTGLTEQTVDNTLRSSNVTWFLDSLDEALIGNHAAGSHSVWREVETLVDMYPHHCFVVSCRSSHIPLDHSFEELAIRNFDPDERVHFIDRYLRFFAIEATADDVVTAIPEQALPLATTPLLLSMMVSAYVSDGKIPDSADELYRQFVCQVLDRIEADRPCKVPSYVKDLALASLAFEMLVSGRPAIQKRGALQLLARRVSQLFDRGEVAERFTADVIYDELLYSGIIVNGGSESRFLHLTLLEYFAACEMNREYSFVAQSEMDQYFLRNPEKIRKIILAAEIRPGDRVVEVGAGIGSVARQLPDSRALALVDLDPDLVAILRFQFPEAKVILGDAVRLLRSEEFDIVISNLPFFLTRDILDILAHSRFRTAVMSIRADDDLTYISDRLGIEEVTQLHEQDFFPRQPFQSRVIRVQLKTPEGDGHAVGIDPPRA